MLSLIQVLVFGIMLNFAWDAPAGGVPPTGYKLHVGSVSGTYTQHVDVGNVLIKALDVDVTSKKFVTVTAYNDSGESLPSNELVLGPPDAARNLKATKVP